MIVRFPTITVQYWAISPDQLWTSPNVLIQLLRFFPRNLIAAQYIKNAASEVAGQWHRVKG